MIPPTYTCAPARGAGALLRRWVGVCLPPRTRRTPLASTPRKMKREPNPHASALGKLGAKARNLRHTVEERRAWAAAGGRGRAAKYAALRAARAAEVAE